MPKLDSIRPSRIRHVALVATPILVAIGCGGVTDIDFQGHDAGTTGGTGGTILGGTGGGTGGGITDGGAGNAGGSGNFGGGGVGNTGGISDGGSGNVAGTGVVCGGQLCTPPSTPIGQVDSCCVGDKCGITSSLIGSVCVELGQPGKPDPTCPAQSIQGIPLQGCCKPNGICGVLDTFIGVGCVDPSQFGGPPSPKCGTIVVDAGTGGTGGVDAGTGGIGGSPTDASTGGTGAVSADGGIPGEVYCDNAPSTIVCSAQQNCCLLNPGQEYCTAKATPCACAQPGCDATTVSCDGPEDCGAGQVCCGTFSQAQNAYTKLACQTTCAGQFEREICKPNSGKCSTAGQTCSSSQFLPNYIWRCN
ncbi:MAG: hypothetical protein U0263_30695 [Polyangiaceae bacterium]